MHFSTRPRVNGESLTTIADILQKKKVLSPMGKHKWAHNTINKILHNEKYIGEVLYQKTYVADLFEGKQVKNDRDLDMYHHTDHHKPLVSKEVFEMVRN